MSNLSYDSYVFLCFIRDKWPLLPWNLGRYRFAESRTATSRPCSGSWTLALRISRPWLLPLRRMGMWRSMASSRPTGKSEELPRNSREKITKTGQIGYIIELLAFSGSCSLCSLIIPTTVVPCHFFGNAGVSLTPTFGGVRNAASEP